MKYLIIAAILIVIALLLVLKKKKEFNEKIDQTVAELNPRVNEFYCSFGNRYIAHRDELAIKKQFEALEHDLFWINSKDVRFDRINAFKADYKHLHDYVLKHNKQYVEQEIAWNSAFLSDIDGKSLDQQQREVVVSDEDHTLVVAGAGSGKTLTIAAKVKYLCEIKKVNPEDILLLSFSRASAKELNDRIAEKYHLDVKASTFHALGLSVLKDTSKTYNVEDRLEPFIRNYFETEIQKDTKLLTYLIEFFAYYLQLPSDLEKYKSLGEAYEHEKTMDLETIKSKYSTYAFARKNINERKELKLTLNNEEVKSLQEVEIANFLFLHGVNYEYESLYKYQEEGSGRRVYRPDFYLPDYDIYIEHFGVDKNMNCPWLSGVEAEKYVDDMEWKRETHKAHKTKLIETYSYYHSEGRLLTELEKKLLTAGVEFKEVDLVDIFNSVYMKQGEKYFSSFIELCVNFINHFSSCGYEINELDGLTYKNACYMNEFFRKRAEIFKGIIKPIIVGYKKSLSDSNTYDFSDMINLSAKRIREGYKPHPYKYVIVDEYQDMSIARYRLLKEIIDVTGAKLLCVGDDWQSIYRFSGSDISLFTSFSDYFGYTNIQYIEKTYRNSQQLIDFSGNFVMMNPRQMKKNLISGKDVPNSAIIWHYEDKEKELIRILDKIIEIEDPDKSIFLLGRTSYDFEVIEESSYFEYKKKSDIHYVKSPDTPIRFMTIHGSKGLEADNVILLNFENSTMGFPNKIQDDPLLELVLSKSDDYFYAEERRLFYVATTRTRNRVFILTDAKYPSEFKRDCLKTNNCSVVGKEVKQKDTDTQCPRCKTGYLVKRKSSKDGSWFIGCSNYPNCKYTINSTVAVENKHRCPECGGFLSLRPGKWGPFYGCSNYPRCNYTEEYKEIHYCPECNGELRLRKGPKGIFWGCSNYPKCKYTRENIG